MTASTRRIAELAAPFRRLRHLLIRLRGSRTQLLAAGGLFATAIVLAAGDRPARFTLALLEAAVAVAVVRRRLRLPDGAAWEYEREPSPQRRAPAATTPEQGVAAAGPHTADALALGEEARRLAERRAALAQLAEGIEQALATVAARGAELAENAEALRRRSADIAAAELDVDGRERILTERAERARDAEHRVVETEKEIRDARTAAPGEGISPEWLDRWAERLSEDDKALRERARGVEEGEAELRQREARLVADAELRLLGVERRERELAELEARLGERARELEDYVVQVQRRIWTAVAG